MEADVESCNFVFFALTTKETREGFLRKNIVAV